MMTFTIFAQNCNAEHWPDSPSLDLVKAILSSSIMCPYLDIATGTSYLLKKIGEPGDEARFIALVLYTCSVCAPLYILDNEHLGQQDNYILQLSPPDQRDYLQLHSCNYTVAACIPGQA